MRTRALCTGLVAGAMFFVAAPTAVAATAVYGGGTLTITGDGTAETFTISSGGGNVVVSAPSIAADPDGGGAVCSSTPTTATCADATVGTVVVNAGGGTDLITDIRGSNGDAEFFNGEAGADTINVAGSFSAGGFIQINGGSEGDTLTGNDSTTFNGGSENDLLIAGTGSFGFADTGGAGNDTFNGSAQRGDSFFAEAGSDTYNGGTRVPTAGEQVNDPGTYQRNNALDSISYSSRADALSISIDNVANDGSAGEADNVGVDMEDIDGGTGADTITAGGAAAGLSGDDGADTLVGGASDDSLLGDDGNDVIAAGGGDDYLDDGDFTVSDSTYVYPFPAGADTLDGGPGNDYFSSDRGADNLIGGTGQDSAGFGRVIAQAPAVTTPLQSAGFTISLDDAANDGVTGAAEADNVHSDIESVSTSGLAADSISGSAAANSIFTSAGNDVIDAGAGSDIVDAGDGDDAVSAVDQTTDRIDCGRGTDVAALDLAGFQPLRADVAIDCEGITGQAFAAVMPFVDTRKPTLKLKTKTVKVKTFLKNRTLPITVTCSKPCSLSGEAFTLKARLRVTAKVGQFKVGAGRLGSRAGTRSLKIKVSQKYMKTFKRKLRTKAQRKRGISFILAVTASDAIGIQASATKTIKVRG